MKNILKKLNIVLLVLVMVVLFALPAYAQDDRSDEPDERGFSGDYEYIVEEPGERPPSPEEFGTQDFFFTWISPTEFFQHETHGALSYAGGYYSRTAGGGSFFTATLDLPTGVDIWEIRVYLYDPSTTANISGWLFRWDTDTKATVQLKTFETTGNVGYTTISWDPILIFNNYHKYALRLRLDSTSHRFSGARIKYKRRISPPPSTATFTDVPTNHPFFREIEALAASGITTGFPDGTFRPTANVSRQAMAAFLARALGLHHLD